MKSRGVYETPGGTILLAAHRGIESITLDGGAAHLKDEIMPRYAKLIYNGFWFSPEREMLQALIDKSQEHVTGTVRVKLYKGNATVIGRDEPARALRPGPGHLRGRLVELRPARRGGLHPAQRAEAADRRETRAPGLTRCRRAPSGCPFPDEVNEVDATTAIPEPRPLSVSGRSGRSGRMTPLFVRAVRGKEIHPTARNGAAVQRARRE